MYPPAIDWEQLPHKAKYERLVSLFHELGRVIVAYSGGVDSTLLAKVGALTIGDGCIAVTAYSETLTEEEYAGAARIAQDHGFHHETIEYSELAVESYAENPLNRCYFCKHELMGRLQELARLSGAAAVIDGNNADDTADWRPGMQASAELGTRSLLREADLHKAEIRDLARALGLPNWDKPSAPCLSSRIAYGVTIDRKKLEQVAEGERCLRDLGFRQVRVRHHDHIARIEVAPEEISRLAEPEIRERVARRLRELGFRYVTVDLQGYRMGSLNEGVVPGRG